MADADSDEPPALRTPKFSRSLVLNGAEQQPRLCMWGRSQSCCRDQGAWGRPRTPVFSISAPRVCDVTWSLRATAPTLWISMRIIFPPGDTGPGLETFIVVILWGASGIEGRGVRSAAHSPPHSAQDGSPENDLALMSAVPSGAKPELIIWKKCCGDP